MIEAVLVSLTISAWMVLAAIIIGERLQPTRFGRALEAFYDRAFNEPFGRCWDALVHALRWPR